ncbi:MAG: HPF/RaiA family ribosome-associated protein, partial [Parcubacteria group bacterium]|nr:HPF/RaiA family ribosome-associated protein [Parcubacteria group bacterium]
HHQKGDVFRAEADIRLAGKVLRVEATESDLKMAIVRVKDELQRQLNKYKDGARARERRGARIAKKMISIDPLAIDPNEIDMSLRHRDE